MRESLRRIELNKQQSPSPNNNAHLQTDPQSSSKVYKESNKRASSYEAPRGHNHKSESSAQFTDALRKDIKRQKKIPFSKKKFVVEIESARLDESGKLTSITIDNKIYKLDTSASDTLFSSKVPIGRKREELSNGSRRGNLTHKAKKSSLSLNKSLEGLKEKSRKLEDEVIGISGYLKDQNSLKFKKETLIKKPIYSPKPVEAARFLKTNFIKHNKTSKKATEIYLKEPDLPSEGISSVKVPRSASKERKEDSSYPSKDSIYNTIEQTNNNFNFPSNHIYTPSRFTPKFNILEKMSRSSQIIIQTESSDREAKMKPLRTDKQRGKNRAAGEPAKEKSANHRKLKRISEMVSKEKASAGWVDTEPLDYKYKPGKFIPPVFDNDTTPRMLFNDDAAVEDSESVRMIQSEIERMIKSKAF